MYSGKNIIEIGQTKMCPGNTRTEQSEVFQMYREVYARIEKEIVL